MVSTEEILRAIEVLTERERMKLLSLLVTKYPIQKEDESIREKLQEANAKVDAILPNLWERAERNLRQAEVEFTQRAEKNKS